MMPILLIAVHFAPQFARLAHPAAQGWAVNLSMRCAKCGAARAAARNNLRDFPCQKEEECGPLPAEPRDERTHAYRSTRRRPDPTGLPGPCAEARTGYGRRIHHLR